MNKYKDAGGVAAGVAVVVLALVVAISAFAAFLSRQLGGVAMFFTAEIALTAALFLPVVLRAIADRETLSVYREMSAHRLSTQH